MFIIIKRLNKIKYKELYEYVEGLCKAMGIHKKVGMKITDSKFMTGLVYCSNYIELTKPLINIYDSKPFVVKLIIAHELVHLKYKDYGIKRAWWTILLTSKCCVKILLQESRADIEGASYSGLTNEEIHEAHMIMKNYNKELYKSYEYKFGYASRDKRSYYSRKYKQLNDEAIIEIITDYCNSKKIIILKFAKEFLQQCK